MKSNLTYLIAESNPEVAQVAMKAMKRAGFNYVHAPDFVTAVKLRVMGSYDRALVNFFLPYEKGFATTEVGKKVIEFNTSQHLHVQLQEQLDKFREFCSVDNPTISRFLKGYLVASNYIHNCNVRDQDVLIPTIEHVSRTLGIKVADAVILGNTAVSRYQDFADKDFYGNFMEYLNRASACQPLGFEFVKRFHSPIKEGSYPGYVLCVSTGDYPQLSQGLEDLTRGMNLYDHDTSGSKLGRLSQSSWIKAMACVDNPIIK